MPVPATVISAVGFQQDDREKVALELNWDGLEEEILVWVGNRKLDFRAPGQYWQDFDGIYSGTPELRPPTIKTKVVFVQAWS